MCPEFSLGFGLSSNALTMLTQILEFKECINTGKCETSMTRQNLERKVAKFFLFQFCLACLR